MPPKDTARQPNPPRPPAGGVDAREDATLIAETLVTVAHRLASWWPLGGSPIIAQTIGHLSRLAAQAFREAGLPGRATAVDEALAEFRAAVRRRQGKGGRR